MLRSKRMPAPGVVLTVLSLLLVTRPATSEEKLEELGRLFTEAAQRQKLDAVRHGAYDELREQNSTVSNVTVNGIMVRGDGKNVVWLNNKSSLKGSPVKGVKVLMGSADPERFHVQVIVDGKRVNLKPGQSWSDGTGTVRDNY